MAYCYILQSQIGRLHVCHLNGDYGVVRGPVYNVWERRFSDQELRENWRMLVGHSRIA
jgi:hypothetical protein